MYLSRLCKERKAVRVGRGRYLLVHPAELVCSRALRDVALRFAGKLGKMDDVRAVYLVGSVADRLASRFSDVDLVVVIRDGGRREEVLGLARGPVDVWLFEEGEFEEALRRDFVLISKIRGGEVLFSRDEVMFPKKGVRGRVPATDWLWEGLIALGESMDMERFWDVFRRAVYLGAWLGGVDALSVPMALIKLANRFRDLRGLMRSFGGRCC